MAYSGRLHDAFLLVCAQHIPRRFRENSRSGIYEPGLLITGGKYEAYYAMHIRKSTGEKYWNTIYFRIRQCMFAPEMFPIQDTASGYVGFSSSLNMRIMSNGKIKKQASE
ncbi:MAG: hypothetical protein C0600_08520 [Ignavibacteria bacterium]|nr:MAG: hypothetical protein C0600_08520 [Ignavibacteria bacterium]